jgi:hypothetical protein
MGEERADGVLVRFGDVTPERMLALHDAVPLCLSRSITKVPRYVVMALEKWVRTTRMVCL